jgi:hypothetical protein
MLFPAPALYGGAGDDDHGSYYIGQGGDELGGQPS